MIYTSQGFRLLGIRCSYQRNMPVIMYFEIGLKNHCNDFILKNFEHTFDKANAFWGKRTSESIDGISSAGAFNDDTFYPNTKILKSQYYERIQVTWDQRYR